MKKKMTEKRFIVFKSKLTGLFVVNDNIHEFQFEGVENASTIMKLVGLLNNYIEENEQLKNKIDILEDDNENIFIDLNSIGGGKTSDSYAKRCRDYCVHYDEVVANCYLGNNIFEHCEEYEPKYTGKLENSLR